MATYSFDVVSEVDLQEVLNAVDQAKREIENRYDFKGSAASIDFNKEKPAIMLTGEDEGTMNRLNEVLLTKMVKRNVPTKALEYGGMEPSGKVVKREITIQQGLSKEQGKEVVGLIKKNHKKIQAQIMNDQVRVTGKSKDELQAVITDLKSHPFDFDLQFINYR